VPELVVRHADLVTEIGCSGLRHLALRPEAPLLLLGLVHHLSASATPQAAAATLPVLAEPVSASARAKLLFL